MIRRRPLQFVHRSIIAAVAILTIPEMASAKGIFSQLTLSFDEKKPYSYRYDAADHALIVHFEKTSPAELDAFEHYDERLVKRLLMTDLGPQGTKVKLVLRDRQVRALVHDFRDPFRITIDLFEPGYEQGRDPETGLPMISGQSWDFPEGNSAGAVQNPRRENGASSSGGTHERDHSGHAPSGSGTRSLMTRPEALSEQVENASAGIGSAWSDYPVYIYRTTGHASGERGPAQPERTPDALQSTSAMADYASRLYDSGHESKSLVAYQKVLHNDSSLFDKNPNHLWKLAEIHLGRGNLKLTKGYFESLINKHPQSPLASWASLRLLDVRAIEKIQQNDKESLAALQDELKKINAAQDPELRAQVEIRKAYWSSPESAGPSAGPLPEASQLTASNLARAATNAQNPKTALLASSLRLSDLLSPTSPWTSSTGKFAQKYFNRFTSSRAQPFRKHLKRKLYDKLNETIQSAVETGNHTQAINHYESLPRRLRAIDDNPKTAWSLAEAYRSAGRSRRAVSLYEKTAKSSPSDTQRFKALLRVMMTSAEAADALKQSGGNANTRSHFQEKAERADDRLGRLWNQLKAKQKRTLAAAYKDLLEDAATGGTLLESPPRIVLERWTESLSTQASTTAPTGPYSDPRTAAVELFKGLARRFGELGLPTQKRKALKLLKHIRPADLGDDKNAKRIWSRQLLKLAEDYRTSGQYLEAGNLYDLVGTESENWSGRAEALYKAGLLLYRAGKREEAIQAFKRSSQDGNNRFYSNLAKERLSQLQ